MSEAVRLLWVHSSYKCASIHEAMTDISSSKHQTSDQHKNHTYAAKERDFQDFIKILDWLYYHNPFCPVETNLKSISSGITSIKGEDNINSEDAEEVGLAIKTSMNGKYISEISFSKNKTALKL